MVQRARLHFLQIGATVILLRPTAPFASQKIPLRPNSQLLGITRDNKS
jgi:hypothetical protein